MLLMCKFRELELLAFFFSGNFGDIAKVENVICECGGICLLKTKLKSCKQCKVSESLGNKLLPFSNTSKHFENFLQMKTIHSHKTPSKLGNGGFPPPPHD